MSQFNASEWMNENCTNLKTKVRVGDLTVTLTGALIATTDKGLSECAAAMSEPVKTSLKGETDSGRAFSRSGEAAPKVVSALLAPSLTVKKAANAPAK